MLGKNIMSQDETEEGSFSCRSGWCVKKNFVIIAFLVCLGALVTVSVLFYLELLPNQSSSPASADADTEDSPSGGGGALPLLRTEDLEIRNLQDNGTESSGAESSSNDSAEDFGFAPGPFLEKQFPLQKVDAGKTYVMLCRYVMQSSVVDNLTSECFGLSVVKFVKKEASDTEGDVQMITVAAGCVDPIDSKAPASFVRLNHDPTEINPSEAWQFNIEKLAVNGVPKEGIPVTTPPVLNSCVVFPKFCLLKPGKKVRTVTFKSKDLEYGVGPLYMKIRPPQPFPILFSVPPLGHGELGVASSSSQYLKNKSGTPESSWFFPVGMTCIPANSTPEFGGYLSLKFLQDQKDTLFSAFVHSSQKDDLRRSCIAPKSGVLLLEFNDVVVPADDDVQEETKENQ